MREVEIKLRVNDLEALEKKLTDAGLVISKEVTQHDVVYSQNDPSIFTKMREGLLVARIRREGDNTKVTLKRQRTHELDNDEYETKVEDGQVMHQILLTLGWKPEVEVKKTRKKGKLGEYEVCLDDVEGLGTFMELEKMTDDANSDAEVIRKELFEAVKPFGLSEADEEKLGYDTQLFKLKNK